MKIGVFDSGVGGQAVVNAIQKALPDIEIVYADDKKHLPYGNKTPAELLSYVLPILEKLTLEGCHLIVIACNTITTTLIGELRAELPVPLIGTEPMIKPAAALTKTCIITVCATPLTLASARYADLKKTYAQGIKVLEPDCSDWALMIESNQIDHQKIYDRIDAVCNEGADVIVLGCTHYHWIEDIIKKIAQSRAVVLQPEVAVIEQLKRVLKQLV